MSLAGLLTVPVGNAQAQGVGAASRDDLPPLDPGPIEEVLSDLPADDMTGALISVTGDAGRWSDTAGVSDIRTDRPVRPDGLFRVGSVTKAFTATVALQLVEEGELRLSRPVQRYLPDLLPKRYPTITVGEVLNHTSGLPYSMYPKERDPRWFVRHRFLARSPREIVANAAKHPMVHKPGVAQRYNGVNYWIAGLLVEKVTGHSYAREVRNRITRPLGLRDTYVPVFNNPLIRGPHAHGYVRVGERLADVTEQSPYAWAEGGMVSSAADLRHFLRALLRGALLAPAQQRKLFELPDVPYTGDDSNCSIGPNAGRACYSMGLTNTVLPNGVSLWGKSGSVPGYTTAAFATRDLERVLVYNLNPTGNQDGSEAPYVQTIVAALFDPELLEQGS
ncbi:serine hydrolase domain-containing protein [Solicola gregarius]|uniref:Beta-lactamase family protein n=1 Tax=Solicola gregarius TaxID=2908642 RepID=A0AA46YLQ1_9ACTN|nr:serine hydrolase domain-containing protein [Solicola gregarius]UYM05819.1 beta-lactamase family protein [Solicola gregarius]